MIVDVGASVHEPEVTQAQIRELERPLADVARASELGGSRGGYLSTRPATATV